MNPEALSPLTSPILSQLLRVLQPWMLFSSLVGITSASAFFVIAGRGFLSLPAYLVLGLIGGPLFAAIALSFPGFSGPLAVGEVDLLAVVIGTWLLLGVARALRL